VVEINNKKREDARAYEISEKLGLPINTVMSVIRELRRSYTASLDNNEPVNMLGLFSITFHNKGTHYAPSGRTTYQRKN
jgi:hypothetical protein